ncbi:hypothetical protein Amal_03087 [Acetobacter malorum]|uniref:Uncharacterized protein n=1 Tax=Acetobacter malorum TaxID=178901 RepID=A0A177G644_9PROT|nr:hypothetical protein Amal_03087 [Acetobacter malorum]
MSFGIGVQQEFVGVEAVSGIWFIRPMDAQAIKLTGVQVRYPAMKDLVCVFRQANAVCFSFSILIKKADVDGLCVRGKDCKIDA